MKKGIIVVSFGTTYELTRKLCIESIENRIKEEYRDCVVKRAFTSQMVIDRLKKRDNYLVDNPREALDRMKEEGINYILIQPLHIIPGHEYEKLLGQVEAFHQENHGFHIKVGKPLLYDETDYIKVVEAIEPKKVGENEGLILMGHGTDHLADHTYTKLEKSFREEGHQNVYIGTVEGQRTIEDIIPQLKKNNIRKVTLMPFMLVAGDHAINDMASEEEDSWRTKLLVEGIEVDVILKGLGEIEGIQDIYIDHFNDIVKSTF